MGGRPGSSGCGPMTHQRRSSRSPRCPSRSCCRAGDRWSPPGRSGGTRVRPPDRPERHGHEQAGPPLGRSVEAGAAFEPVLDAPGVLAEQHVSELLEPAWRVVEHVEDRVAFVDRERNLNMAARERGVELVGRVAVDLVAQPCDELGDKVATYLDSPEPHTLARIRLLAVSPLRGRLETGSGYIDPSSVDQAEPTRYVLARGAAATPFPASTEHASSKNVASRHRTWTLDAAFGG